MASKKKKSNQSSIPPAVNFIVPGTGNKAAISKAVATLDSLPLEMLQLILESGGNTKTIKSWRLVSKSWNDACCRIMRKVSAVPLNVGEEEGEDLEKFKDLIIDRQTFPSDWPNPFQNFKVLDASLVTPNLLRFIQRPNVKITTLEIVHEEGFDHVAFGSLLVQIKGELTHLKINGKPNSVPFLTLTEGLGEGGWRSLKNLTLRDTCEASSKPCPHVEFIIALKTNLRLEGIHLDGELLNIARLFAAKDDCWDQLIRLEIESNPPPLNASPEQIYELMKWTEEIKFGRLTHLSMEFHALHQPEQTSEQYTHYLLSLIQRYSQGMEDLSVNFMPLSLLPSLPKLKFLSCAVMDGDRFKDITESKFSSLVLPICRLQWTEVPTYVKTKESDSNNNIRLIRVCWVHGTLTEVAQEILWSTLKGHFPKLKKIGIAGNIFPSTLHFIRKRFPGLTTIYLSSATASDLLGTSSVPDFVAKGWPCEAYENCALLEMTELFELHLGYNVTVTKTIIAACLGKLPKIRTLRLHWNNSLEPSDISEHLGHIQDVTIMYSDKEQKRELEILTQTMKGLKLVKF